MSQIYSGNEYRLRCLAEKTLTCVSCVSVSNVYVHEKVIVRSGIRTHASRGDCDLNAAP